MNIKSLSFLFIITVLVYCSACGNSRNNGNEIASASSASVAQEDCALIFAECEAEDDETVVEQDVLGTIKAYLVSDSCAGPFRIGAGIQEKIEGFDVTKSQEEVILPIGEICEIPVYIYEIGNEGWVKVSSEYDATTGYITGKISEIWVYSDLFLTDKGIGAMSAVEEFYVAYSDFLIRYLSDAELFVAETQQLKNVQFVIDNEYYCGDSATLSSGKSVELQVSDFRKESYFTAIRIIK